MISAIPASENERNEYSKTKEFPGTHEVNKLKGTKKQRRFYRSLQLTPTPTILDREHSRSNVDFSGFFVLFWVGVAVIIIISALDNVEQTGRVFGGSVFQFFRTNLLDLVLADLTMVSTYFFSYPFQKLLAAGVIQWYQTGAVLFYTALGIFLLSAMARCLLSDWPWTHRAFFILHSVMMLMKLVSYNICNGWYSHLYQVNITLKQKESLSPAEEEQLKQAEFELLEHGVRYPFNLTFKNAVEFLFMPTLCYQLYYPRTSRVRVWYLLERAAATFGCIFLLTLISENYIVPILRKAIVQLHQARESSFLSLYLSFSKTVTYLMFPFTISFLLVFYVIFDGVCNFAAELTRFADRNFYDDWWNSYTWDQFARTWNKPVHYFLLRHVYLPVASITSKLNATVITFFLSSILHETIMFCITKKIRGYQLFFQMTQIPYIMIQRNSFFRQRVIGNVAFWISMIIGISLIAALYILC
ncbi:acyl-coA-sterol acyltransferase [Schizosaccharomyces japonicus yFS275]|uniref:O-acyltransferase n=1 Tax=Schizosaccharomyces japonicus (strain yFS275 / FY16936) TaxID=402676 RepID=B6K5S3_SCHJY|nr:acyl-coA-sterol acyltransferase [Schizosaccharomyces japonicus yFS275]EEB08877.1 acyl-coA-sterol acyltransferase [Schizosaccharomyces japonicus yFS275]